MATPQSITLCEWVGNCVSGPVAILSLCFPLTLVYSMCTYLNTGKSSKAKRAPWSGQRFKSLLFLKGTTARAAPNTGGNCLCTTLGRCKETAAFEERGSSPTLQPVPIHHTADGPSPRLCTEHLKLCLTDEHYPITFEAYQPNRDLPAAAFGADQQNDVLIFCKGLRAPRKRPFSIARQSVCSERLNPTMTDSSDDDSKLAVCHANGEKNMGIDSALEGLEILCLDSSFPNSFWLVPSSNELDCMSHSGRQKDLS
ncbi:hypothetical protein Anapl_05446 [Anas platyrhynchos]|uniref:Uncharacterized protein n=1 Tax=Anas platyrhynchos TaxID=8839 RepID=R0K560_ANAPL|nr:hypothetical protein Anapl_05446 [Anas platyrhynchos]